ncbi:MAG TPA: hypothetical protein VF219_03235 [Vicinamibacterales bacterium]
MTAGHRGAAIRDRRQAELPQARRGHPGDTENRTPAETIAALKAMGHNVRALPGWGSLGRTQTIRVDPRTGTMMAGADPRRTGYAVGY